MIRKYLIQESADSWDRVLQSLEPQTLSEHTESREATLKDIGCLLQFVFVACIDRGLRDNRTQGIFLFSYDWRY